MPEQVDPRGQDNPSQYFVEDRGSNPEMVRLMIQDEIITTTMGGPLAEQADASTFQRVLDVGCGPGGWILEAARFYPEMSLVGIDISWRMIEYARAQTQARKLTDGVEFLVMDALQPLAFADASFDLVNMRLGTSFMKVEDWPRVLHEFLRVTRAGGIIRVTDAYQWQSTSPAQNRITSILCCALYHSGHSIVLEKTGVTDDLPRLLAESGCQQVESKDYVVTLTAGTVGAKNHYYNAMYGFQTLKPFFHKWGCAPENYDAICEQALVEIQQADFCMRWPFLTVWGVRP